MKTAIKYIGDSLAILISLDVVIVLFTLMQIADGRDTAHIPFWDTQIRFFINLIS